MKLILHQSYMEVIVLREIKKIDAFTLVMKTSDSGDQQTANKMMQVIIKSIRQNRNSQKTSQFLEIADAKDAQLFKELLIDVDD